MFLMAFLLSAHGGIVTGSGQNVKEYRSTLDSQALLLSPFLRDPYSPHRWKDLILRDWAWRRECPEAKAWSREEMLWRGVMSLIIEVILPPVTSCGLNTIEAYVWLFSLAQLRAGRALLHTAFKETQGGDSAIFCTQGWSLKWECNGPGLAVEICTATHRPQAACLQGWQRHVAKLCSGGRSQPPP